MKRKSALVLWAIALVGLTAFLLKQYGGAGTSRVSETPTGEAINSEEMLLLEVPRKVGVGQIVNLRALLLRRNGRPLQVQPVVFSANGGEFVSGSSAYTDNWGEVYAYWKAPLTSGTFTLQVHYFGPEGQAISGEAQVEVLETPPSHQILVDYAPTRMVLGASEDEFVSFSIRLVDQQGNPVAGGTVNLRTNLGQFRIEKVESRPTEVERWVEIEGEETSVFVPQKVTVMQDTLVVTSSQEVNLVTDDYGSAWVALYPPDQPGVATINVSTSQQAITVFCVFTTPEGLHLTSDSFCAVGNDGAQIIARLYDAAGNPISGQVVTFHTTLGQLSSSQAITDENGEAVVTLFGSGTEGTAVVTASALGYTDKIYVDIFHQLGSNRMPIPLFRSASLQTSTKRNGPIQIISSSKR